MILKEYVVKKIFTYNLFTIIKPGYPSYLEKKKKKNLGNTLIIGSKLMQCIRCVYFYWFLLCVCFTAAEYVSFCTKQSSTWMNFISRNQTLAEIWLLTSVLSEFTCADAFFCFVSALSFYVERTEKTDYLNVSIDCAVWWHLHWIFVLCCLQTES